MTTLFSIIVIALGLIAWAGQILSFFTPQLAIRIGVLEPKEEVDETLYVIESKAMGLVDVFTAWVFPTSGLLLLLDNSLWPIFGLIGAGIYLYFSGVIVLSRIYLKRIGKKVGSANSEKLAYIYSFVCIFLSLIMIIVSVSNLVVQH